MSVRERFIAILLPFTLSGCPPGESLLEKGLPPYDQYHAAWALLTSGDDAPSGRGAYAYIVFTSKPGSDVEKRRYEAACEALVQVLPAVDEYPSASPESLMVTYWPLAHAERRSASTIPCSDLIDEYNYRMASDIAISVTAGSVRGPILVAWRAPFTSGASGEPGVLVDLSSFSDEDLKRALLQWRARIAHDPEAWKDGLAIERFREGLRNFIQLYGDSIMSVIRPRS